MAWTQCESIYEDECGDYQCQRRKGHSGQHEYVIRWDLTEDEVKAVMERNAKRRGR